MDIMIFILYYSTLLFSLFWYILLRKKGIFSISDAIILVTTVVISVGGYYISYGYSYGIGEFSYKIFLDYFIFIIVLPLGLIVGSKIVVKNNISKILDIRVSPLKVKTALVFIFLYAGLYFYFIKDSIPILLVLKNGFSNMGDIALARVSITHDYELNYNMPFLLRYYRLIINDLLRFIFVVVFLMYLSNKKYRKLFLFSLLFTVFTHIYHFEKSGLIYLVLSLFFAYVLLKGISIKENFKIYFKTALLSVILLMGMYMVFMGANSFQDAFSNLVRRAIVDQSGMIYYQNVLLESKYDGVLWGDGVPTFLLDSVLNRQPVNLSREAYGLVFPYYAMRGATGTTGNMPMFYLRSNFGYLLGTSILFIISLITGAIDNTLRKNMEKSHNKILITALYSVLIIYFIQAFIGNFTRVYMLPFILSPQILIIIIAIIYFKFGKRMFS